MLVLVYPRSAQGDYYYIVLNVLSQGSEDQTCGPHTAHYVQLRHFIYFSPSSASTEGEYGILEPKFPDGGHCQSVLRRQWVLFTSTLNVRVEGTSVFT